VDNRAVAPVVGKLLAAAIAVLYVAGTTAVLLGGVVPEYRTAAGEELSERTLAEAAAAVDRAVPETTTDSVGTRIRVDLPASIRDASYSIVLKNGTLALDHPDSRLDRRTQVQLPSRVDTIESTWESGETFVVVVSSDGTNRTVELRGKP
jgi:FlaG/FlaF family flagellin (archaellin)